MNNKPLRFTAMIEGTTLILLVLIAVPLKYKAGIPAAVSVMGPVHGVAFMVYVAIMLITYLRQQLGLVHLLVGLIAAFIPFGSFIFERKILRHPETD